jgi:predicted ATP-grasp superfamily ATP-dependent carboligase
VYSFGGVVADGLLIGSCFARYRRTWPPGAGSAACAETLEPPPGLSERVLEIVTRLGWEGIFELEFVGRDGPAETIDFNPRLYGSLALSISAGANLPALWCDWLLGHNVIPATARPAFGYRWEEAEVRYLFSQLARGRLRAAAAVMRPRRQTTHAIFRLGDPLPLLADALRVPVRLVNKTRRLWQRPQVDPVPVLPAKEPQ